MGWRVATVVATGRVKVKVAPWPSRLSTETWPPSNSTSRRTSARPRPGALVMRGIEAPEEIWQPLGFDAPTGVAHGELHLVLLLLGLQQDGAVFRCVADRIAHQVVHDAAQGPAISIHMREISECLDLHIDVLFPDLIACPGASVAKNIDGPESIHADFAPSGIDFRDLDQIGHEVVEALRVLLGSMKHFRLQGPQLARET